MITEYSNTPASVSRVTIAFVGDSITAQGSWQEWFPGVTVIPLGVGGERTDGLLARLDTVIAHRPDMIVLLIGTNDIGHDSTAEHVTTNIRTIITRLKAALPDSRILVQSPLPRQKELAPELRKAHSGIVQLAEELRVSHLDPWPALAEEDGELHPAYTHDRLHLSEAGYHAWLAVLTPAVDNLTSSGAA
jgi:lysophospholipase L1-like esterase